MKSEFLNELDRIIDHKIETLKNAIATTKESKSNETKSSVGDKFETGRAMMQREQDQLETQLGRANLLKTQLQTIDANRVYIKIEFGSLVELDAIPYFLSIGLGKINYKDKFFFAISLDSPIGRILIGKKTGDTINFRNKEYKITSIS